MLRDGGPDRCICTALLRPCASFWLPTSPPLRLLLSFLPTLPPHPSYSHAVRRRLHTARPPLQNPPLHGVVPAPIHIAAHHSSDGGGQEEQQQRDGWTTRPSLTEKSRFVAPSHPLLTLATSCTPCCRPTGSCGGPPTTSRFLRRRQLLVRWRQSCASGSSIPPRAEPSCSAAMVAVVARRRGRRGCGVKGENRRQCVRGMGCDIEIGQGRQDAMVALLSLCIMWPGFT